MVNWLKYPENCPPVRVRVWIMVRVSFRVGGQFSSGAIIVEPLANGQ